MEPLLFGQELAADHRLAQYRQGLVTASQGGGATAQALIGQILAFRAAVDWPAAFYWRELSDGVGGTSLMATCSGMELTNRDGDLNHQNAFPLKWVPFTNSASPRS